MEEKPMMNDTSDQLYEMDTGLISDALKIRFFPHVTHEGNGVRLYDTEGKQYLDFSAGWAVANTGYSHPHVKQAVIEQLERTTYGGLLSSMHLPSLHLAEKLVELVPGNFPKKVWFGLSGSDASETAGRLLHLATGKRRMVSFIGAYHGSTAASMTMSAHVAWTQFIGGGHVTKIPYPHPYRCPFGGEISGEQCAEMVIRYLEDYIFKTICPPQDVAGIIVEAVQSDGGDIVPPPNFLPMLEEVCRRYDTYLIVDEVKVGMGRTGEWFAFQHSGVTPDMVILGKALGGGLPLSAVVGRKEILDVGPATALFTTAGNALSCTAGLATIEAIQQDSLVDNARKVGSCLHDRLGALQEKHPLIGNVRGLGLIQGVELVKDRDTKEPAASETAKVVFRACELGLVVFYAGMFSNVLELTPPLILTEADVDEGVSILDQAISDVVAGSVSDEAVARYAGW
jgi:4-aminobutyrate aminotransferase